MPMISGGNVMFGNAAPGSKPRIWWLNTAPTTDASVYANSGATPAVGDLAGDVTNGRIYERTGVDAWTRRDVT